MAPASRAFLSACRDSRRFRGGLRLRIDVRHAGPRQRCGLDRCGRIRPWFLPWLDTCGLGPGGRFLRRFDNPWSWLWSWRVGLLHPRLEDARALDVAGNERDGQRNEVAGRVYGSELVVAPVDLQRAEVPEASSAKSAFDRDGRDHLDFRDRRRIVRRRDTALAVLVNWRFIAGRLVDVPLADGSLVWPAQDDGPADPEPDGFCGRRPRSKNCYQRRCREAANDHHVTSA